MDPENEANVVTVSATGEYKKWNYTTGEIVKEVMMEVCGVVAASIS